VAEKNFFNVPLQDGDVPSPPSIHARPDRLRSCRRSPVDAKGAPHKAPPGMLPWFRVPDRFSRTHTIVCGHWSALGFYREPGLVALDSGCVWGGKLTALRIEDDVVFQVPG
jgi:bis(5'-nucleosyl)-tetraphosphatase (symmetrical)